MNVCLKLFGKVPTSWQYISSSNVNYDDDETSFSVHAILIIAFKSNSESTHQILELWHLSGLSHQ